MIFCFGSQIIFSQRDNPYLHHRVRLVKAGKPVGETRKISPDAAAELCRHAPPPATDLPMSPGATSLSSNFLEVLRNLPARAVIERRVRADCNWLKLGAQAAGLQVREIDS